MIPPCTTCGAQLGPQEMNCRYCGTPTPLSHQRHWHDKHASAARAAAVKIEAESAVHKNANYALIAALTNVVCCPLGLPGLVALVLGLRTRSLARAHGLVVPGRALAAACIGGFAVLAAIAFWIWFGFDMQRLDQRRTDLRKRLENRTAQITLDQETACWMVELRLLEQGFEDTSEFGIEHVHCDGNLTQDGERATLHDVSFTKSTTPWKGIACFKRSARWSVDTLTTAARCDAPLAPSQSAAPRGVAPTSSDAGRKKAEQR